MGYARAAGLPYEPVFLPPPNDRLEPPAFIPKDPPETEAPREATPADLGDLGVRLRWRVVPSIVEGRSVILVAPALSTGKLLSLLVRQLTDAGAHAVHVRVASPPATARCPYGVASPITEELLLGRPDTDPARALVCDSFAALSLETLRLVAVDAIGLPTDRDPPESSGLCDACLSGRLPVVPERVEDQLPLF